MVLLLWTSSFYVSGHQVHGTSRLVCIACTAEGYSARSWRPFACGKCGRRQPAASYDERDVTNHRQRGSNLLCRPCLELRYSKTDLRDDYKCSCCQKCFPCGRFNSKQLEHYRNRGSRLVCHTCATKQKSRKLRQTM